MDSNQLAEKAIAMGFKGTSYANVNQAMENFISKAEDEDLIVVCGSIFIVGEVDRTRFS
jgi:dihydrofolate synthase/folylpolyglutamate synthase